MEDILQLLTESNIVHKYEILGLLQDEDFYYLKIKSHIKDNSVLYIKIYLSDQEYNYAFHWQKESGELINRWDNAPHHRKIRTFPHHMHTDQKVDESYSITLNDILHEIEKRLKEKNNDSQNR